MEFAPPQHRRPRHPKYDAIHRALLAGLISNVGIKSDTYEYLGLRSARFSIFPGSALFSQKPKWLMAAELVETTKLYARTNAGIQPQWIERAADHLVVRTYSDPRYDNTTASVLATEKVALYGLVLIPARPVPYGPINPRISRELFIHHALVLGDFESKAPFIRHNAALIAEVETLEAKIRQRNLLADIATRYAFYDARLPQDIYDGARFETWRRKAEHEHPHLLYMNKDDLLRADAPPITPEYFPDRVRHEGLNLPLRYKYEPTDADDGISLTVPLAALTQLRPERYEWLVPGMLEEKIGALLRALPGGLRRNFVPVPDWAKSAAAALLPQAEAPEFSLREALANYLAHHASVAIAPADFPETTLPDHLRMAFTIVDDAGKILSTGRDLPALQRKLAPQAATHFSQIYQKEFHRDGIMAWDFGDLPESLTLQRFGMTIHAITALVDQTDSCALRLFPAKKVADAAHRGGLRRLFRFEHRKDTKFLAAHLPHFEQMALHYYALGKSEELRELLTTLVIDRALFSDAPLMRQTGEWHAASAVAAIRLLDTADTVCTVAAKLLAEHHTLRLLLSNAPRTLQAVIADIQGQLARLLPANFFLNTPWEWLQHYPRYLAGIRLRLEKLTLPNKNNLDRDLAATQQIAELWAQYLARQQQHAKLALDDPELELFRWMLEELRISLFAQELGTPFPISPRRMEKQWDKVRK